MFSINTLLGSMVPGSHLISSNEMGSHHGIYIGNGEVVCFDMLQKNPGDGAVIKVSLREFSFERKIEKRYYIHPVYTGEKAVERALLCLNKTHVSSASSDHKFCLWVIMNAIDLREKKKSTTPSSIDIEISIAIINGVIGQDGKGDESTIKTTEKNELIPLGAHLVTPRRGYTHHGIYIGDGEIIHYSGLSKGLEAGPIEKVGLEAFSDGREVKQRKYKSPVHTGIEAVERAFSRIGEDSYDFQANNCEHFCSWVIMGRAKSDQVEIAEDFIEMSVPIPVINTVIKTRRYSKQKFDGEGLAQDATEMAAKTVVSSVFVGAWPAFAAYKVAKWVFRE